ncbi:MAG TPA: hypothetical protein VFY40_06490 [Blastocatellia bacterium]|nr:hypothetical protein [Blastocatellia bacterium]
MGFTFRLLAMLFLTGIIGAAVTAIIVVALTYKKRLKMKRAKSPSPTDPR